MKQNMIVIVILAAIVAGGAGFFAGTKYQQNKRGQFFAQMGNGQRNGNQLGMMRQGNGGRNGFRPVAGEVIKSDDSSITVKMPDGSTKIILVTPNTTVNKAEKGSKTDIIQGTQVAVFGQENTDGSVTAQNIQINPIRMGVDTTPTPTK